MEIVQWIIAHKADLLAIIGAAAVLASAIVAVTPTPRDDAIVGAARRFLERLSVVKPTEGVVAVSTSRPRQEPHE